MPLEIDYAFGKTAVHLGNLTQDQLEECVEVLIALERVGSRKRLWDVIAGRGYMDSADIAKVREEAEREVRDREAHATDQQTGLSAEETQEHPAVTPPQSAEFVLAHLPGDGYMRLLPVNVQATTIGESPDCDIVLQQPQVSARHARLTPTQGGFKITDTGSEAGVVVNGRRVTARELQPNDLLELGSACLLLLVDYANTAVPMPTRPHVVAGSVCARLRILEGPGEGATFFLGRHPLVIGRHRLANVRIEDPSVSNFHVHLTSADDGFSLTDLKSKSGTLVNGLNVAQKALKHKDRISVGPCTLSFEVLSRVRTAPSARQAPGSGDAAPGEISREELEWDVPIDTDVEPITDPAIRAGMLPIRQDPKARRPAKSYKPCELMLSCVEGPTAGQRTVLVRERTVIGRKPDSDIHVQDVSLSRRHAEIILGKDGALIRDLNSKNGIFVNGTRVTATALHSGDTIRLGKCLFIAEEVITPPKDKH